MLENRFPHHNIWKLFVPTRKIWLPIEYNTGDIYGFEAALE